MASLSGADVFVTFGADTKGLEAAAAAVRQKMAALAKDMRTASAQFNESAGSSDYFKSRLKTLGEEMGSLRASSRELQGMLSPLTEGGGGAHGKGSSFFVNETRAIFDEISGGRLHQAVGSISRLGFALMDLAPAATAGAAGFLALAAAVGYFAYEAYEGNRIYKRFRDSLAAGGKDISDQTTKDLANQLHNMAGLSSDDAEKTASSWALMKNGSAAVYGAMASDVKDFASVTGQEVAKATDALKTLFEDPGKAADKLASTFGGLTAAEQESLKAAQDSIDPAKAQAANSGSHRVAA